jgi:hypothetical protein
MPDKMMIVVKKQAPTPKNTATPRLAKPGQTENTRVPKASIVVALVRRIALPVPEKPE